MTADVLLAFVLGFIGGIITAILVAWSLISKLISVSTIETKKKGK